MLTFLRTLWFEPRAEDAPPRRLIDWLVPICFIPATILEAILRPEVDWRVLSVVVAAVMFVATVFRRRQPLLVLVGVLGLFGLVEAIGEVRGVEWEGLIAMAGVLMLPYALARWAAGWEIEVGVLVMLAFYAVIQVVDWTTVGDAIGGAIVFFFPVVLGIAIRYQRHNQRQTLDEVRLKERELLARELHDTVAHHVSAIAIQAQAGRAVAATRPELAQETLAVVEEEASRTLVEMRTMIGALRDGDEAELAPQRGVTDIARLAEGSPGANGNRPAIEVHLRGELEGLRPSVDAALYRLAQESITNSIRHARRVSRIQVRIVGGAETVRLTVVDDGDVTALGPVRDGYGLVGMAERAKLLGGTLTAGPRAGEGWRVEASLPKGATGS